MNKILNEKMLNLEERIVKFFERDNKSNPFYFEYEIP